MKELSDFGKDGKYWIHSQQDMDTFPWKLLKPADVVTVKKLDQPYRATSIRGAGR